MLRLSASGLGCIRGFEASFSDLNFELCAGENPGLVGPERRGKSSLLRLIAGLLPPPRGRSTARGAESDLPEQAHYLGHLDASSRR
jgi:ABC-type transport system involved in cytochrome c biogenesis ATPase subunit